VKLSKKIKKQKFTFDELRIMLPEGLPDQYLEKLRQGFTNASEVKYSLANNTMKDLAKNLETPEQFAKSQ